MNVGLLERRKTETGGGTCQFCRGYWRTRKPNKQRLGAGKTRTYKYLVQRTDKIKHSAFVQLLCRVRAGGFCSGDLSGVRKSFLFFVFSQTDMVFLKSQISYWN